MRVLLLQGVDDTGMKQSLVERGCDVIATIEKMTYEFVREVAPDFIVSYRYKHIVSEPIVSQYKNKIINLHISLLPHNRGMHPNFWSFWNDTPAGVTIHYMDSGLDTGDILAQEKVIFNNSETLGTSFEKLQTIIQRLFLKHWNDIKVGNIKAIPQNPNEGSYHYLKEFEFLQKKHSITWDTTVGAIRALGKQERESRG